MGLALCVWQLHSVIARNLTVSIPPTLQLWAAPPKPPPKQPPNKTHLLHVDALVPVCRLDDVVHGILAAVCADAASKGRRTTTHGLLLCWGATPTPATHGVATKATSALHSVMSHNKHM